MEGWKEYKPGDLIHIKHGYAFKGEYFTSEETNNILLTPGNFKIGGGFKDDKLKYYNGPIPKDYVLKENDIVVTMTDLSKMADTLGFSAKVPSCNSNIYLHNQRIGLVEKKDVDFDIDFLYWLLRFESYQKFVAGSATGATVKHTSPSKIYAFKFKAPAKPETQRKIAKILSAYDDLIENNIKRIKLLEEMAQKTYEEWFVRFKFPGYETAKFDKETGLPEGWKRVKLGEVCNLIMGQSPKSEFYNTEKKGLPFHQGVKDYGDRFPTNTIWSTKGNRFAEKGTVLFSVRAPVGRLNIALEKIILGRGLASISYKNNWNGFLYYQLKQIFFEDNLMGGGAIFNSVTKNDMLRIDLIEGENKIMLNFNDFVNHIDKNIKNLHNQNQRLKEARDILLPRLMTGMIDV